MDRTVLYVAGPSGAGKTTVSTSFANRWPTYLEDPAGNPFLPKLLTGASDFDALSNQLWFLQEVERFISSNGDERIIVVDQHPAAIVQVYGRMFLDTGKLSADGFQRLSDRLGLLEEEVVRQSRRQLTVFLDASEKLLHTRVALRNQGKAPDVSWFRQVRGYFAVFVRPLPNCVPVCTDEKSIGETIKFVRSLVEDVRS